MEAKSWFLIILIGSVSGYTGYYVFTRSGPVSGITAIFAVAWLLYMFSSAEKTWRTLGTLKNPPLAGLIGFLLGFVYFASQEVSFLMSLVTGIGTGILAAVIGSLLYKYWNIGEP